MMIWNDDKEAFIGWFVSPTAELLKRALTSIPDNEWDDVCVKLLEALGDRLLDLSSGFELPIGGDWRMYVTVTLQDANERLDSIRLLLLKDYIGSANVLLRSLFELAANLAHISRNVSTLLPQYLKHGRITLTTPEAERLAEELKELREHLIAGEKLDLTNIVSGRTWKHLKKICEETGGPWPELYLSYYRIESEASHSGSLTLPKKYAQLRYQQPQNAHTKAVSLVTALEFHLGVLEIAANVFPEQIELPRVFELRSKVAALGGLLASYAQAHARASQNQVQE